VHTFTSKPAGTVSLTIYDTHGCKGTIKKNNVGFLKAQFNANMTNGCGPLNIAFSDNSDYASNWQWNFGDGTTSTKQNPVHFYKEDGMYTVKLVVRSATGCIDSIVKANYIHVSKPTANFFSPDKANCAPSYVTFKDQSKSAVSWFWDFGDSVYSYNSNPAHIYNRPGNYTVKLIVKNSNGCTDTLVRKNYVRVLGPISAMTASATKACPGTEVSFVDRSKDAVAWDWNFGDGSTSHDRNPKHAFTDPGSYTVTLITHDTFGCTSLATLEPQIKVFDRVPPAACPIRRVTVNSNTSVEIDWTASQAEDFSAYRIYRLNEKTGQYALVSTITNVNQLTYVDDNGLNTLANTYTYKVQAVDFCGFAISLDSLTAHTTVNISASVNKENINLSWTPYKGANISSYSLFRVTPDKESLQLVAIVPSTQLKYTDTSWTCPIPYSYRVVANNIGGDSLMSFSDTSIAIPVNLFKDQKVDVVRSTVVDNKSVLTEWKAPTVLPGKVSGYRIYRSLNGFDYKLITTVSPVETSYMDNDVDVSKQNYFYRIEPANECDIQAMQGLHGSSILLGVRNYDDRVQLDWTGYDGWTKGVGYYVIERMRSDGTWETVGKVDGKRTTFDDEQH
jgi:PKD repeat protein